MAENTVHILCCCGIHGEPNEEIADSGFRWPLIVSSTVEAPIWQNGDSRYSLIGAMYGEGSYCDIRHRPDAPFFEDLWLVVECQRNDIDSKNDGKVCSFRSGLLRFSGILEDAAAYLLNHEPESLVRPIIGAKIIGDDNEKVIVGDFGTAITGTAGMAIAGYNGLAVAGDYGTAICEQGFASAGAWGRARGKTATVGDHGIACAQGGISTAGKHGIVSGSLGSVLQIWRFDPISCEEHLVSGIVSDKQGALLQPQNFYELDALGQFRRTYRKSVNSDLWNF